METNNKNTEEIIPAEVRQLLQEQDKIFHDAFAPLPANTSAVPGNFGTLKLTVRSAERRDIDMFNTRMKNQGVAIEVNLVTPDNECRLLNIGLGMEEAELLALMLRQKAKAARDLREEFIKMGR